MPDDGGDVPDDDAVWLSLAALSCLQVEGDHLVDKRTTFD